MNLFKRLLKKCILCGKYKLFGEILRWSEDDNKTNYQAFVCKKCLINYREE